MPIDPRHGFVLLERRDGLQILVDAYREQCEPLGRQVVDQLAELWERGHAGAAPGGPEVDEHNLAGVSAQGVLGAVEPCGGDFRQRAAHRGVVDAMHQTGLHFRHRARFRLAVVAVHARVEQLRVFHAGAEAGHGRKGPFPEHSAIFRRGREIVGGAHETLGQVVPSRGARQRIRGLVADFFNEGVNFLIDRVAALVQRAQDGRPVVVIREERPQRFGAAIHVRGCVWHSPPQIVDQELGGGATFTVVGGVQDRERGGDGAPRLRAVAQFGFAALSFFFAGRLLGNGLPALVPVLRCRQVVLHLAPIRPHHFGQRFRAQLGALGLARVFHQELGRRGQLGMALRRQDGLRSADGERDVRMLPALLLVPALLLLGRVFGCADFVVKGVPRGVRVYVRPHELPVFVGGRGGRFSRIGGALLAGARRQEQGDPRGAQGVFADSSCGPVLRFHRWLHVPAATYRDSEPCAMRTRNSTAHARACAPLLRAHVRHLAARVRCGCDPRLIRPP